MQVQVAANLGIAALATPALLAAFVALAAATVAGQSTGRWTPPRTSDGRPDLQGYWTNATYTQLERDPALGSKEFFTPEEERASPRRYAAAARTPASRCG